MCVCVVYISGFFSSLSHLSPGPFQTKIVQKGRVAHLPVELISQHRESGQALQPTQRLWKKYFVKTSCCFLVTKSKFPQVDRKMVLPTQAMKKVGSNDRCGGAGGGAGLGVHPTWPLTSTCEWDGQQTPFLPLVLPESGLCAVVMVTCLACSPDSQGPGWVRI